MFYQDRLGTDRQTGETLKQRPFMICFRVAGIEGDDVPWNREDIDPQEEHFYR